MGFDHSLRRFDLVADGNATANADAIARVATVTNREACLAFSVAGPSTDSGSTRTGGFAAIFWSASASLEARIGVAGQDYSLNPYPLPDQGSGGAVGHERASWNLTRGQRVSILIGGSDPDFARLNHTGPSGTPEPGVFRITLETTGPTHLLEQPMAGLACGAGFAQSQGGTALVRTYGEAAVVGGRITMATRNSTTLAYIDTPNDVSDISVHFLNDTPVANPIDMRRSTDHPGQVVIDVNRWSDQFGGARWFVTDAFMPALANAANS